MDLEDRETLLVILGAGASFDCLPPEVADDASVSAPNLPAISVGIARPPLTRKLVARNLLVNRVLGQWEWARPVVDKLRRSLVEAADLATILFGEDTQGTLTLEAALRLYEESTGAIPERKRHILATRFFLRDLLWACTSYMLSTDLTGGITNQLTLLQAVLEWCGTGDRCAVFVSFNYDLILERAMESTWDFNPSSLESYVDHDRIHLLKPHGSVQWHWPLSTDRGYINAPDAFTYGRTSLVWALSDEPDHRQIVCHPYGSHEWPGHQSLRAGVPALALPVDGKTDLIWPKEQEDRIASLQGTVTRLLAVGWRALEPHFLSLLRPLIKPFAHALVVSGGDNAEGEAVAVRDRLQAYLDVAPGGWRTYAGGFKGLMEDKAQLDWVLDPGDLAVSWT